MADDLASDRGDARDRGDFTKPGQFAVGLHKVAIPEVTGMHPLPTVIWYPAAGPAPDPASGLMLATKDAPPRTTGP